MINPYTKIKKLLLKKIEHFLIKTFEPLFLKRDASIEKNIKKCNDDLHILTSYIIMRDINNNFFSEEYQNFTDNIQKDILFFKKQPSNALFKINNLFLREGTKTATWLSQAESSVPFEEKKIFIMNLCERESEFRKDAIDALVTLYCQYRKFNDEFKLLFNYLNSLNNTSNIFLSKTMLKCISILSEIDMRAEACDLLKEYVIKFGKNNIYTFLPVANLAYSMGIHDSRINISYELYHWLKSSQESKNLYGSSG